MALSRLSLAFSLLLLSFIAIASAGDYGAASSKYGFDGIPADSPQAKPEEAQKPQYGTKPDYYQPKPVYKEKTGHADDSSKYGFDGIPANSPQAKPEGEKKPTYGTNQDTYKPKPKGEKKPTYGTNQDTYKLKPEGEKKPNYGTNQDIYKPKPEGEEKPNYVTNQDTYKLKPEGEKKPTYDTNQGTYKPKPEENEKSGYNRNSYVVKQKLDNYKQAKPDEKPGYGKGSKYYPIQGALATITCKAVDEIGVEKTISFCSKATDAKGYFFIPLSGDNLKVRECKAYLKSCPLATCNVPTNVNKAIEGALLSAFRVLNQKKTQLYSVGPFFYTSQATPAPTYGY
ncbi:putative Integrase-type DNA-binding superfamily protein [Hibiscus syriacus]|uniref:Integrase-type DNA-binding superfamily protein n=1 Tax=Hibiscus syriacus TaxID=106335 RepID=A0A6A2XKB9_HIBSY|nr:putative Integrase-type DNA-binding superfamily protein [Hibiscus syriacus]